MKQVHKETITNLRKVVKQCVGAPVETNPMEFYAYTGARQAIKETIRNLLIVQANTHESSEMYKEAEEIISELELIRIYADKREKEVILRKLELSTKEK